MQDLTNELRRRPISIKNSASESVDKVTRQMIDETLGLKLFELATDGVTELVIKGKITDAPRHYVPLLGRNEIVAELLLDTPVKRWRLWEVVLLEDGLELRIVDTQFSAEQEYAATIVLILAKPKRLHFGVGVTGDEPTMNGHFDISYCYGQIEHFVWHPDGADSSS